MCPGNRTGHPRWGVDAPGCGGRNRGACMNESTSRFPLTLSDLVVIGGYLLLVLLVGLYYRRRMHSAEDYFAGGHGVPWWLAGVSHYMSSASALAFVSYSQVGYTYGWTAISLIWVSVPGCIV